MPAAPASKDTRRYITVTETFPEHPKVVGLSDKAFRALIELWCYCSRTKTDGAVPSVILNRYATTKARNELAAAGLIRKRDDTTWDMHDYLKHQWSRGEIEDQLTSKQDAGAYGAHVKHHEKKGIENPSCKWCKSGLSTVANG